MTKNRFHYFTDSAKLIFVEAQQSAERYQQTYIAPEHLLLGIANGKATTASRLLNRVEIDPLLLRAATERAIADRLAAHPDSATDQFGLTQEAKEAIELAVEEASHEQRGFVGSEHLLLALLRQQGTLAVNVLEQAGLSLETVRARLQRLRQEGYTSEP
ncbi:Clp protease N-terminal domain-containing protein [Thermogemmatispora onikobensis]|uniref:Clp protease N-terminal domain-containing protein n=1 Tax=Thermogemmatispora onikobensis TaxID=732234 RepID=UPI0008530820|nr:Clp protease N-terminal domain-containing protein [Thermogemmatispora onikobensis]